MTPTQLLRKLGLDKADMTFRDDWERMLDAMEEYGEFKYNEALTRAKARVRLKKPRYGRDGFKVEIDKESIDELRKHKYDRYQLP